MGGKEGLFGNFDSSLMDQRCQQQKVVQLGVMAPLRPMYRYLIKYTI